MILLAVLSLEGDGYGIAIQDFIHKRTGTEWSFAQIYGPLNKLARKEYVSKSNGEPTPERGGRHKCFYSITARGKAALAEIRGVQDRVWSSVTKGALS
jgi:PadR family transcriptional regulator PadR